MPYVNQLENHNLSYSHCGALWDWGISGGCKCDRENCYYCRYTQTQWKWSLRGDYRCHQRKYPNKYLCWDCQKGWKHNGSYGEISKCPTCGQEGLQVSHVVKIPKYKNTHKWKLLKKLLHLKQVFIFISL